MKKIKNPTISKKLKKHAVSEFSELAKQFGYIPNVSKTLQSVFLGHLTQGDFAKKKRACFPMKWVQLPSKGWQV